ncbi:RagB/SusD family nutrient uptake outer membrane protein [Galbibacter pacificus]|uniref:RagB/SusD family nutrient uptake outer membrane protein n=1 Tax=Galbibacter pacificus TaxID=2996052 RepID=A0ABT6FMP6_9FLAO|nr:RagB/SusD family nutrient uptake outer membrane protein [Galbibacter pacificus]MDG3581060.1 RagB/SusD family nutrient uptake outer membrane protein [Galbibacter pacificus]MDG3584538.1 RagB/SusD family nutrient uptake outer membrane protein [Galbibacter pacificus]
MSSCQDLEEDPKADLTPGTYFQSQSDLDGAVASMYEKLARDGAWGFTSRMTSYFGSDDLTTDPGLNKADMRDFDRLSGSDGNASLRAQWEGPWKAIYQANNVLDNYEQVNSTEELKLQSAGQAYFMRGMCYYYLVRTFGELPIITTEIDVNDRPPRESISKVYDQIVSDLNMAIETLPPSFEGEPGKADQIAAKAMLSDVYLTMAGWPLNDEPKYALSAKLAKEVMDTGEFSLMGDYLSVFTTNNNSESIFALQYNVDAGLPQRSFGSSAVPLEEEALNGMTGWDDYYSEINFFLNAPDCKRTDDTFYTTFKLLQKPENTFDLVPWDSPRTRVQHPYYKKFRAGLGGDGVNETDTEIISMNPSTNKTLEIIRYPQVLLNYAEASTMSSGGPSSESYAAINQVRSRAGLDDLTTGLSREQFRDSVVYERAYEFAGEFGIRWFDIVRLQLLPQIISERAVENENALSPIAVSDPANYYLAPIPDNEMSRNPEWQQNPGY